LDLEWRDRGEEPFAFGALFVCFFRDDVAAIFLEI